MAANKIATYTLSWWEKIIYGVIYGILIAFSHLPFCIHYFISDGLYLLAYRVLRYRVKLVRKNLHNSFPEKSEQELRSIERGFYHFLGDYVVETVKMMTISREQMQRHMVFENMELVNDAEDRGQSVSLYLGHYCNWEWITSIGLQLRPTSEGGQIYHILENRIFDKLFCYIRTRWGTFNVPQAEILRKRIECKQKGKVMVMGYIADQVPFWNNIHYWTDFLHHDTPVLTGAETLTKRFNDRAVYLDISRPKRGYYRVEVKPIGPDDSKGVPDFALTEQYFRLLEASIQRQPELWLWTHNRWKRTREEFNRMYNIESTC